MQSLSCEKVLLELSKIDHSCWEESIKQICSNVSHVLKIERVSIWLYNYNQNEIVCECLYRLSAEAFEKGMRLGAAAYPRYFKALEENLTVAAHDARTDPRTSEFTGGYLVPLQITSMMDVPIRLNAKVIGVVCHEHVGAQRRWTTSEQEFAAMIANFVSLSYASSRHKDALEKLRQLRHLEDGG